jgi:hypothetical protein
MVRPPVKSELIGARFKMSPLGSARCPFLAGKEGIIIGGSSRYAKSVLVRFDGNKSSTTLHRDYIELVPPEPERWDQAASLPARSAQWWGMPRDPFIREKFTRERSAARKVAQEYFERFPKNRYRTEVESWRNLQSANIEFTMKRLCEPIETGPEPWNAPAAVPARHARGATYPIRTGRRGCRMASGRRQEGLASLKPDKGWSRHSDDPIPLADGILGHILSKI